MGTIAHPKWTTFSPLTANDTLYPRVVTFICKDLLTSFTAIPIPSLLHYDLLGIALEGPSCTLHILNFYHHVQGHQGNLLHILQASLDHSTPIVLGGDFNTHFELWSLRGKKTSPWAITLETWLDTKGFLSTVPEGAVSHVSSMSRPSLIDFIFVNEAFLEVPNFPSTCSVSFKLSLGSDHVALLLPLPILSPIHTPPRPLGWIIYTLHKDKWIASFHNFPLLEINNMPSLLEEGQKLLDHIAKVSNTLFSKKCTPRSRDLPWWSRECSLACTNLRSCHWQDCWHLSMVLRMTIRNAKWEWVDRMIDDPEVSIWDLAKWRKGCHLQEISPIAGPSGLTHDPATMSSIFHSRFFDFLQEASTPPKVILHCNLETHLFLPIREDKISSALRNTSLTSAPGPSGIGYLLIHWAFEASPGLFTLLFSSALSLGRHPWGDANVVIIPKPGKSDYTVAKAYHPISLLECCGKLLEKVVAACLAWEVDHISLIGN